MSIKLHEMVCIRVPGSLLGKLEKVIDKRNSKYFDHGYYHDVSEFIEDGRYANLCKSSLAFHIFYVPYYVHLLFKSITSQNVMFLLENIEDDDKWNVDHCKEIRVENNKLVNGNHKMDIGELSSTLTLVSEKGIYRSIWQVRQIIIDGKVYWDRHRVPTQVFKY